MAEIAVNLGPHVPGETPIDPSGLRPSYRKWVRNRGQLNQAEADNLRLAYEKYLVGVPSRRKAPFDCAWLKRLNRDMFGKVWTWAGTFRSSDVAPVGSRWFNIEADLSNMLEDLKVWPGTGMPLIEQAATLHHRATAIHPFLNGNGRWARLLANILLKQKGAAIIDWPTDVWGGESRIRGEYIAALRAADKGHYGPLIEMHKRHLARGGGRSPTGLVGCR